MNWCTFRTCKSVVQFFLFKRLKLRLELILQTSQTRHVVTRRKTRHESFRWKYKVRQTYLVDLITHSDGVGDSIGNFVCEVHLFSNRVHSLVDLVDVA